MCHVHSESRHPTDYIQSFRAFFASGDLVHRTRAGPHASRHRLRFGGCAQRAVSPRESRHRLRVGKCVQRAIGHSGLFGVMPCYKSSRKAPPLTREARVCVGKPCRCVIPKARDGTQRPMSVRGGKTATFCGLSLPTQIHALGKPRGVFLAHTHGYGREFRNAAGIVQTTDLDESL